MRVLVFGAGAVGSATGKGLLTWGHDVTFVDTDPQAVRTLQQEGYSATMPMSDTLAQTRAQLAFVSVPTPLAPDGSVSLSSLDNAVRFFAAQVRDTVSSAPLLIVVRSTVPPGTTRNRVLPMLREAAGWHPYTGYAVCFHPQLRRLDSGEEDFLRPGTLVAGVDDQSAEDTLRELYTGRGQLLAITSLEAAELVQYTANCFNAAKTSFSNEIWQLASSLGIDGNEVLEIASKAAQGFWDPKYGITGGAPYDGDGLIADTLGLLHIAGEAGLDMPLLSAVTQVNRRMEQIGQGTETGASWMPAPRMRASDRAIAELEKRMLLARPPRDAAH